MSEVTRHLAGDIYEGAEVVYATDFDRVTAERDALRNEVGQIKGEYDRAVNKVDALQALLTAADEKNDTLSTAYVSAGEREHEMRLRVADLEGLLQMFIENTDDKDVIELAQHALHPADGSKPSTCTWSEVGFSWRTGCGKEWQFTDGGLPAENGMHFCHSCGKALVVESAESA